MSFTIDKIFVNLAVKDLARSLAFFRAMGLTFNEQFTNEQAAAMVISDHIYAMLLTEEYFRTFTKKEIADATRTTEVLVALHAASRAEVDLLVDKAVAAGATIYAEPVDHGFMYVRTFADLDGHQWEIFHMQMGQ